MQMSSQTSRKSGVASTAEKLESAHHPFDPMPQTQPVPGAVGKEGPPAPGSARQPIQGHTEIDDLEDVIDP
jgi:hypothetical protein